MLSQAQIDELHRRLEVNVTASDVARSMRDWLKREESRDEDSRRLEALATATEHRDAFAALLYRHRAARLRRDSQTMKYLARLIRRQIDLPR